MNSQSIPYRHGSGRMLIGLLVGLLGAGFMAWVAMGNDRGLILYHLIKFGTQGATIFYWVIAGIFAGLFVHCLLTLFSTSNHDGEIILSNNAITLPGSVYSSADKIINYRDIIGLKAWKVNGQAMLEVKHNGGKMRIAAAKLPDENTFLNIARFLQTSSGVPVQ